MASKFELWPAELISLVAESLPNADLSALRLSCSRIRYATEPLFFCSIAMIWLTDNDPDIAFILQLLITRPELCDLIKEVRLQGNDFLVGPYWNKSPPRVSVEHLDMRRVEELIEELNMPHSSLWTDEVRSGSMDGLVTLLFCLLPNLTSFHIGPNFGRENRLLGMTLRSLFCTPHVQDQGPSLCFQHARTACIDGEMNTSLELSHRNTEDALSFCYLPNARYLSLYVFNPIEFSWPGGYVPDLSNLTHLHLARLREENLHHLLSLTPNLTSFKWSCLYKEYVDEHVSKPVIRLNRLVEALQLVRGTLQELTLSGWAELSQGEFPELEIEGSLGGLRDFERITDFAAPWVMLMDFFLSPTRRLAHSLPRNLERLTIGNEFAVLDRGFWNDDDVTYIVIRIWLDKCRLHTPKLQVFALYIFDRQCWKRWHRPMRERLRDLCRGLGVVFEEKERDIFEQ